MKDRIGGSPKPRPSQPGGSMGGNPGGQPSHPSRPPRKKKSNMMPIIILIAVVAIAVGIFLATRFMGNSTEEKEPSDVPPVTEEENPEADAAKVEEMKESLIKSLEEMDLPGLTDLQDTLAIRTMLGEVQSGDDGVNAGLTADPNTGLAAKAVEFKTNTNSDTVGWLKIPNTNIDYAVVQSLQDNNYYSALGYDKQYSKDGVLWAHYRSTADSAADLSSNVTIFGHNWYNIYSPPRTLANAQSNDVMLGLLPSYEYLEFAQQNPFIYYSTLDKDMVWQVFAVYYTDVSNEFPYIEPTPTREEFQAVLAEAQAKSLHNFNVNVTTEDKVLTLSTCSRVKGNTDNQRFVVMAKLVEEGTPSTEITSHTNVMQYNARLEK